MATFAKVSQTAPHDGRWISTLDYGPDGQFVATENQGEVSLWDAATGGLLDALEFPGARSTYWLDVSPDGTRVAVNAGRALVVLDRRTHESRVRENAHEQWIEGIAFSPDGKFVTTCSPEDGLKCWDAANLERVWIQPTEPVSRSVAYHPHGTQVVCGRNDGSVSLFRASDGAPLATFGGHGERVTCLAFSPDGRHLFTGSQDGTVKGWELDSERQIISFPVTQGVVWHVAVSPDGQTLAASDGEGYLSLFETGEDPRRDSLERLKQVAQYERLPLSDAPPQPSSLVAVGF
jgi:WD40 repeat protein